MANMIIEANKAYLIEIRTTFLCLRFCAPYVKTASSCMSSVYSSGKCFQDVCCGHSGVCMQDALLMVYEHR